MLQRLVLACAVLVVASSASAAEQPLHGTEPTASPEAVPADPRREARELAASQLVLTDQEKLLIDRPDRRRAEHPLTFPVFGRPLALGGRYTLLTRYDRSKMLGFDYFDLDNRDIDGDLDETEIEDLARGKTPRDDQLRLNQGLQLDLFYPFTKNASFYAEFRVLWWNMLYTENTRTLDEWIFERGELWLYLGRLFDTPLGLQVGRQAYFDEREWWWDADLDSVRVRFDLPQFHAEVAVAQELLPEVLDGGGIEPEDSDVLQIIGSAQWRWARKQLVGVYALHRRDHSSHQRLIIPEPKPGLCVPEEDIPPNLPPALRDSFRAGCPDPLPPVAFEDDSDSNLTWLGATAAGRWKPGGWGRLHYRMQVAGVFGSERFTDYSGSTDSRVVEVIDEHDVAGWGLDLAGTWELGTWVRPHLTLGYAVGSGDPDMLETTDTGFRQTGLQDNKDSYRGVVSLRYYGELFDPELSNMQILTAGLGLRFMERSSIDFLYHKYTQVEPAPFLRDVGFKRDPDGVDADIGQEWDLILGIEDLQPFEFKLVGSVFRPGRAFRPEEGELSYLVSLRIRLNF